MEALTPTFSLLSEAPGAVYEVAFSKMRIAAVTGASAAGDRGVPTSRLHQARPSLKVTYCAFPTESQSS